MFKRFLVVYKMEDGSTEDEFVNFTIPKEENEVLESAWIWASLRNGVIVDVDVHGISDE